MPATAFSPVPARAAPPWAAPVPAALSRTSPWRDAASRDVGADAGPDLTFCRTRGLLAGEECGAGRARWRHALGCDCCG